MVKRLLAPLGVMGLALGLIASPAGAFQCPMLINQANQAIAKLSSGDAKAMRAQELVAEAQRLHDAGQHGDSEKKANEALGLLGLKKNAQSPARRGYGY